MKTRRTSRSIAPTDAAKGAKEGARPQLSADQVAFQQLMRGIHF